MSDLVRCLAGQHLQALSSAPLTLCLVWGRGGPAEPRSHIVPTRVSLVSRCLSVPRCYSLASMCSFPLLTQVFTSPEIRFTEHSAFQKPGDTSGALQFNGAHYGNQLNAEERDKSDYLPTPPTRDRQPTLMGAHLWPHSVTQPSLSATVTNLQREVHVCMKELTKGLWVLGEGGQEQAKGDQALGLRASQARLPLPIRIEAAPCIPGR